MSDRTETTLPGFGPHLTQPIGVRALAALRAKLGERETGHNIGAIVEWACRRWISDRRWLELSGAGKAEWCAGAVCSAFDDAGSEQIKAIASLSCGTMLERAQKIAGDGSVFVWEPDHDMIQPQPGDILFTDRDGDGRPNHVVLIEAIEGCAPARIFRTVGGNSGPHSDAVAEHAYREEEGKILAIVRLSR